MGTQKSVLHIRRSGNLLGTETIVTVKFRCVVVFPVNLLQHILCEINVSGDSAGFRMRKIKVISTTQTKRNQE